MLGDLEAYVGDYGVDELFDLDVSRHLWNIYTNRSNTPHFDLILECYGNMGERGECFIGRGKGGWVGNN